MITLVLLAAAAAAAQPIDIPSGGSSGPAYGVSVYDAPMPGTTRMEMQYEGSTAIFYAFSRPGWDKLFPMGWKPECPYDLSKAYRKRYQKAVLAARKSGEIGPNENLHRCVP